MAKRKSKKGSGKGAPKASSRTARSAATGTSMDGQHAAAPLPARVAPALPTLARMAAPVTWATTSVRPVAQPQVAAPAPPLPGRPAPAGGNLGGTSLAHVFETLAAILVPYALSMESEMHPKIGYCLKIPASGRAGRETHFGGVQLCADGVAFHLFPLYSHPELLQGVSVALTNCMRGKTCFFVEQLEAGHAEELSSLTQASFERFRSDGLV